MQKKLIIVLLSILIFFIQSCYTVILIPERPVHELTVEEKAIKSFDLLSFKLDKNLIGGWRDSSFWYDYGEVINRLEFRSDGKMIYIPYFESSNSRNVVGEFRTLSDTLILLFRHPRIIEKYKFEIDETGLLIRALDNKEYYEYSPRHDFRKWKREIY